MNTQKRVFKKLAEVEKVELGMHDDMLKWEKRGDDLLSDVKDRLKKIETSLKAVRHNYEVSEGIIEESMQMAKELGADNLINLYKKRETSVKGSIKEVNKLISKIK